MLTVSVDLIKHLCPRHDAVLLSEVLHGITDPVELNTWSIQHAWNGGTGSQDDGVKPLA